MYSGGLEVSFLSTGQEQRINSLLENAVRFSPWGVDRWSPLQGFEWQTVFNTGVPDTVLVRATDHAAVIEIPRYTHLIHANGSQAVFTCSKDIVPTLYVVDKRDVVEGMSPVKLKQLENVTFFPIIHGEEIRKKVADMPTKICGYNLVDKYFYIWTWNSVTGEFSHQPLGWFNMSNPDTGYESLETLIIDPSTGLLLGSGTHIPNFVLAPDGSKLIAFVRQYDAGGEVVPNKVRQIEKWSARLQKSSNYAYTS